jgi:hypothetical protein
MSEGNITTLYKEFKSETEKQAFIQAQNETITKLSYQLKVQEEEILHLKELLISAAGKTSIVIVTPEQALIDEQIKLIRERAIGTELELEDIKKLDLLLKNQLLIKKADPETFDAKFKKLGIPNADLLAIASGKPHGTN